MKERNGSGEQDLVEAYKWFTLAHEQGRVRGAQEVIKQISAKMTSAQIEEAKLRAKSFVLKSPARLVYPQ